MSYKTLVELVKIKGGKRLPKGAQLQSEPNSYPYIRVRDMGGKYIPEHGLKYVPDDVFPSISRYVVNTNDVIISIVGTIGLVSIIDERFDNASQTENCAKLSGLDHVDANYVYYFLKSSVGQQEIRQGTVGAVQAKLPLYSIEKINVYWPARFEREKIVYQLAAIDRKLDLNVQTNQTLEQIAQALFKSWFVDFDPVKAKMSGKKPEGMDAATASLFPEKLVECELGLIPEGWKASCMGEYFNITMGQSPKGETYNEKSEGIAFFQGCRDFGFRYPDVRVFTTDPKRHAKAGDTLISVRAPVGHKNMASIDCCIGRGVAAIKHNSDSRSFTYAFMSYIEKKLGDSGSSGTVFSSINQKELKKVSFVAPPQELIEAFHKLLDPIDQKVEVLSREIESLSSLRDTLLPKLLSGEIELRQNIGNHILDFNCSTGVGQVPFNVQNQLRTGVEL